MHKLKQSLKFILIAISLAIGSKQATGQTTVFIEQFETWVSCEIPTTEWTSNAVCGGSEDDNGKSIAWHRNDNTGDNWAYPGNGAYSPGGANSTIHSARYHSYGIWPSSPNTTLISPAIDLSSYTSTRLNFYYINMSETDKLYVSFSNDGGSTWGTITTFTTTIGWEQKIINIPVGYNVNNLKIKFEGDSDFGHTDIGIDEVTVEEFDPNLIITNVSETQGNTVAVPVNAEDLVGLVDFQWTIEYDDTKLTYVDCDTWHADVVPASVSINSSVSGKLMFTYNNSPNEIDIANGTFFNINFDIDILATGTACLNWSDNPTTRRLSNAASEVFDTGWTDGCITIILKGHWTGDISTEWDNAGNWSDVAVPTILTRAVIPDVSEASNRFPYIDVTAECNNLTINAGANVQIAPDHSLTVSSLLTNSAGVDGLIIKSDVTGTGSLIHSSANVDATVERFFEASSGTQWHFLSSPIIDAPRSMFTANNFYYYDESTRDFWASAVDYQGIYGWVNPVGNMEVMKGYIYYYYQTTLKYTGKLYYNAAGYNKNTSYTTNSGAMTPTYPANGTGPYNSDWDAYDGWNLLGNPYTSAVDWDEVTLSADVQNTVYLYDDATDNYKYYNNGGILVTGTGMLGIALNGGSRFIPVGQGFFVKTNMGGGNLEIPLTARVHNTQDFLKNKETKTQDAGYIRLSTSLGGFSDELIIRVLPDATSDFDDSYDAYKRYSWNTDVPQIYTMDISQNTEYAINTLPNFDNRISIPLGYSINAEGDYFIQLSENKFEGIDVFIEDKLANKNIALNEHNSYNFSLEAGNSKDRFILHLVKNISNISNEVSIFPNPTNGKITIQMDFNKTNENKTITLRDITGKIQFAKNISEGISEIDIQKLSAGTYILTVKSNSVSVNKVVIKI